MNSPSAYFVVGEPLYEVHHGPAYAAGAILLVAQVDTLTQVMLYDVDEVSALQTLGTPDLSEPVTQGR